MAKSPELAAAIKKADELQKAATTAATKASAAGATEADKAAATEASSVASEAAAAVKALEAPSTGEDAKDGKTSGITRILNLSSALHYVGETRILPDNIGSPFSDEEHAEASKNPGYLALLKAGKLKVE